MRWPASRFAALLALALLLGAVFWAGDTEKGRVWPSENRYRILLEVDPGASRRSFSPASVEVDLDSELRLQGGRGGVDDLTVEVVAFDEGGKPIVFDPTRSGNERFLVPHRLDRLYPLTKATLAFVVPNDRTKRYAVFFDALDSGRGRPSRPPGLVGDGDVFFQTWGRREVGASGYDTFADLDGDGDLDLVKGGTEPFLRVLEDTGSHRFRNRGPLSSRGELLLFPRDDANRSWIAPSFFDFDGDGDLDLFVAFLAAPFRNQVLRYENASDPAGPTSFVERGPLLTSAGQPIAGPVLFVDWDGDGHTDVISQADNLVSFHRNEAVSPGPPSLAPGRYLEANGVPIHFKGPRVDAADLDGDGDLDVLTGTDDGRVYLFENVGSRTRPALAMGRMIVHFDYMDAGVGVKIADWNGDGLLDFVVGRYWERSHWPDEPRVFGRLYENVGHRRAPRFAARGAGEGAPFVEGFLPCDAVRQNGVRGADWDGDGRRDLIVGDSDGFVWLFRNLTNPTRPLFAPPRKLEAGGRPIKVYGEEMEGRIAGYARADVTDWNNDGVLDLLVADGRGWLTLFLGEGGGGEPRLGAGQRLVAHGQLIDGTARGSVLVADWDNDGRKDVLFGMVGEGGSGGAGWPARNDDPGSDRGFLFYRNVGTDAAPVLGSPKWIKAGPEGGEVIDFNRPNLGSFADWDGDGRKDLVACEFEMNCRLFRNLGSGAPGQRPRFDASEGEMLVRPFVGQTISGADAVDWNGDGDLDLLTGQGHGGSNLRYFEHDYLRDVRHGTSPKVRVVRAW